MIYHQGLPASAAPSLVLSLSLSSRWRDGEAWRRPLGPISHMCEFVMER